MKFGYQCENHAMYIMSKAAACIRQVEKAKVRRFDAVIITVPITDRLDGTRARLLVVGLAPATRRSGAYCLQVIN